MGRIVKFADCCMSEAFYIVKMEILLRQLDMWYSQAPGDMVMRAERQVLKQLLPRFFGYHLIQIGGPSEGGLLAASPITHSLRLSPEHGSLFKGPSVQGKFQDLPFLSHAADVVIMPHVLEFTEEPQQLLGEVYRVLIEGGHLVLFGFNPFSMWGISKLLRGSQNLPWRGHFLRMGKVQHLLRKAGFSIETKNTYIFRWPVASKKSEQREQFLEGVGQLCWPSMGGIYLIVAQKTAIPMQPIRESLFKKPVKVTNGMPEATTRVRSHHEGR